MMKQIKNIIKQSGSVTVFLLTLILLTVYGCGKTESHDDGKKEKHQAVVHDEKDHAEESDLVTMSPDIQKASGIEVKQVSREDVSVPLSATAVIEINMDRAAKISSRVTGKAVKIIAAQGDRVKAGLPLVYLDSVELDQIWADYRKAQGKVELARKSLRREESLFEKKISPEKDVLKARQELQEAEADINLAKERFRLVGIDLARFAATQGNGGHSLVPLTSPVSGVIIEKAVTQGEVVSPEKTLFMVADLSTLWVMIDVYEKDMSRLKVGSPVKLTVTAFPDKVFKGKISYIADVVDEKTRTEKARVTIDNASGLLKPGMFASVLVQTKQDGVERLIAIPEEAVQIEGATRYVFVQIAPDKFKRRDVETGRLFGKNLEVTAGIREGEAIAVKGAFFLKSELKKSELEGDAH